MSKFYVIKLIIPLTFFLYYYYFFFLGCKGCWVRSFFFYYLFCTNTFLLSIYAFHHPKYIPIHNFGAPWKKLSYRTTISSYFFKCMVSHVISSCMIYSITLFFSLRKKEVRRCDHCFKLT